MRRTFVVVVVECLFVCSLFLLGACILFLVVVEMADFFDLLWGGGGGGPN